LKFNVIGGGPSGLYFALLARRRFPQARIDVYEQNQQGATYGFGIVLADRGLERMRKADPVSYHAIMQACFMTRNRIITHPGETLFVEGGGYGGAIARLRLLDILEAGCKDAGVHLHYETRVEDISRYDDADLVVGADGVNSMLRKAHEADFGTTSWLLTNRLAWYGTEKHFPYPILSFKRFGKGHFVAVAYPYTERMSTFVAECDANTWFSLGMDRMTDDERRTLAEEVYADELSGVPLISNKSIWHNLSVVRNRQWSAGRRVLIGDALHSAHPSIGSGTRIAMEDSIALVDALGQSPDDIPAALARFRRLREPTKKKLVTAAEKSFTWYESFPAKMQSLDAVPFVFDFLTRTGRVDEERLRAEYPEFMDRYASRWPDSAQAKTQLAPAHSMN
jgi:2-polyprenyl-6-methoxyphenol hydroxylase-like FAD-dependent oxidoreductase